MIPEKIGRYEVQCQLGEGAFGQVYAARDPVLGRLVAIKVLRQMYSTDASFMDRFRVEATNLASLAHPNITLIYDLLQNGAENGMIMELVRGHTLEHILKIKSRLSLRETIAVVAQVASGLGYVHRLGVVHRDIKPANIMLTASGALKIMDFGIARTNGAKRLTRDGSVLGTLAYAAPEQIKSGEGDARSDQYSLACMVYEMLCGVIPFEATTEYELMQAQISRMPEPASKHVAELLPEIDQALMRALAKNADDRFESLEEFGAALGIAAVQQQATDILRELIMGVDAIPPIPERKTVAGERTRHANLKTAASVQDEPIQKFGAPAFGTAGRKAPFVVMGIAVAIALGVAGFIFFDSRVTQVASSTPPDIRLTNLPATSTQGPVENSTASSTDQSEPKSTEKSLPLTPALSSPGPSEKSGAERIEPPTLRTTEKARSDVPEQPRLKRDLMPAPVNPELPKASDRQFERPPALIPAMPAELPTYEGRVVSWLVGSTLMVRNPTGGGFQKLVLWGISDLEFKGQRDVDRVHDQLEAYLSKVGREIKCFRRLSSTKEIQNLCYAQQNDLALAAIELKLARPNADAPPHYRSAAR